MKLSRLTLKDFRGFGEAEFDLMDPETDQPLNLALLVGDNGSGKTSALHAIDRGEDLPTWGLLQQALDQILAPNCFAGVDEDFNVNFQTPHGLVPIQALSDGFRSIFVIVADLLMRMNLLSSKRDQALLQEAVCLIDEIDAHLHPRFQERVIPALRTLFPNVQFIATTHSPIIVASVEAKHVFQLSAEGA